MHTLQCGKTTFHFNSDMSGEVEVISENGSLVSVPGGDLVSFVADYVRRRRIAELEDAEALDILGFKDH